VVGAAVGGDGLSGERAREVVLPAALVVVVTRQRCNPFQRARDLALPAALFVGGVVAPQRVAASGAHDDL
jgi:hypothetical protein